MVLSMISQFFTFEQVMRVQIEYKLLVGGHCIFLGIFNNKIFFLITVAATLVNKCMRIFCTRYLCSC